MRRRFVFSAESRVETAHGVYNNCVSVKVYIRGWCYFVKYLGTLYVYAIGNQIKTINRVF